MKIQGLPIGPDGAKAVGGKQNQNVKSTRTADKADVVRKANSGDNYERLEGLSTPVNTEFEPRTELLETIRQRISSREYDRPEVMKEVAARFVEEQAATDAPENKNEAFVRSERLDGAGNNIDIDYYERPEVQYEIAQKVLDIVHPSRIAGDGGIV